MLSDLCDKKVSYFNIWQVIMISLGPHFFILWFTDMGQIYSEPESPQPECMSLGLRRRTQSVRRNPPDTGVKSKLDSAEFLAFRKCFSDFAVGISDPEWISLKLYSEGLIDQNERMKAGKLNKMHSVLERNQTVLSAVEQQIITRPTSKF